MEKSENNHIIAENMWAEGDKYYKLCEFEKAFEYFEKAANAGSAEAMYDLGYLYYSGEGVEKSYDLALKWYEKAADLGNLRAMYKLGLFYEQVDDRKDFEKAVLWYQKAADKGDMYAQCNLGILYYTGLGAAKNKDIALKLLKDSADQGYERAEDMLTSIMYRDEVMHKKK